MLAVAFFSSDTGPGGPGGGPVEVGFFLYTASAPNCCIFCGTCVAVIWLHVHDLTAGLENVSAFGPPIRVA